MSQEIRHSILVTVTIALAFLFSKSSLAQYDLQIGALLFVLLYLTRHVKTFAPYQRLLQPVGFTFLVVALVVSTGGLTSPMFFLIYFLLFALSLFLEPIISITTTLTLVLSFLMTIPENQEFGRFVPLISLAFITPFAMFLGQEQRRSQTMENKLVRAETDTHFFLSLTLKNHITTIKDAIDNFKGDHDLDVIRKQAQRMERLIDEFESNTPPKSV
jgi:hypothetical protein